jgi:hypothetical protein
MLRVVLSLMVFAACATVPLDAMGLAHAEDECCADTAPSSDSDECPCPENCDDECVCCALSAVDTPHEAVATRPCQRIRYGQNLEGSPPNAELDGREPVPRARG